MNEVILKQIAAEIFKMRNKSGIAWAMKNNEDAHKYENIAVGLEQAYRIMANEIAVNA